MRANIRQVAERAQVSRMTVSRVLQNRRSQVTDETYERVVAALQELNYVPVRTAVQNHHTRTNVVGVVPYTAKLSGFQFDLLTFGGLCTRSGQYGYDVLLLQRGESEWMANRQELRFLDHRTDGFVFISPGATEWHTVLEQLTQHQIPVVVCYRRDVPDGIAWVDPDNEDIIKKAIDCLVTQGHTQIAYLGGPPNMSGEQDVLADLSGARFNYDNHERQLFFQERLKLLGLPASEEAIFSVTGPGCHLTGQEARAIVASGATGVVCFSADLGIHLLGYAQEMGLRVPGDLSIVNVDWSQESSRHGLTHVTFSYEAVGELAMDAWVGLTEGKAAADCCKVVPVRLVECASVGPQSEP